MQTTTNLHVANFNYGGWKYYNSIKKKAMEQEFSWSGLILSLSIAFFVVLASAFILSFTYNSMMGTKNDESLKTQKIYYLESIDQINIQAMINKNNKYFYINNYIT